MQWGGQQHPARATTGPAAKVKVRRSSRSSKPTFPSGPFNFRPAGQLPCNHRDDRAHRAPPHVSARLFLNCDKLRLRIKLSRQMVSSAFQESKTVPGIESRFLNQKKNNDILEDGWLHARDELKDKHDKNIHIRQKLLIFC